VRPGRVGVEKSGAMPPDEARERRDGSRRGRAPPGERKDRQARGSRPRRELGVLRAGDGAAEARALPRGEAAREEEDLVLPAPEAPFVVEVEEVEGRRQSRLG